MAAFGASSPPSGLGQQPSISPNDCNVPMAGDDGISSLTWSPTSNYLVSSNWDGGVRLWEVQEQGGRVQAVPKMLTNHDNKAPVLCTAFSSDGGTVFSGGADKAVRMWQLQANPSPQVAPQIGAHDAPVKCVEFLSSTSIVVSGGWDKKLKFWDARQPNPVGVIDMPDRVHAMDVRGNLLVVATTDRQIISYDVSGQPREHSRKESPLKYQTRSLAAFPDQTGFAVGSIEGRVGIHYLQKVPGKESFAFKCHRKDSSDRRHSDVYAVNDICFHNQYQTFATVGADGVVSFWDKDNKQRLKGFDPIQRQIPCASFNAQGNLFAYASSYDWSKGSAFYAPGTPNEIFIHYVIDEEIQPKSKKTGLKSR